MKIAVISDSHDNIKNVREFLKEMKKVMPEVIIHCGDVCAPSTLMELAKGFKGKILLVFGNVDGDRYRMTRLSYEEFKNVKIFGELGVLKDKEVSIAFTHYPEFAKALAFTGNYDIVFHGHTHKAKVEKIVYAKKKKGKDVENLFCLVVCPGSLQGDKEEAKYVLCDLKEKKISFEVV